MMKSMEYQHHWARALAPVGIAVAALALAAWPAARGGDDEKRIDAAALVTVVARESGRYSESELRGFTEVGITVTLVPNPKPDLGDLRSRLDRGEDVCFPADRLSTYDVKSLGKRKGRATAVIETAVFSASDLRGIVEAGVRVEIRTEHLSAYDVKSIAGK